MQFVTSTPLALAIVALVLICGPRVGLVLLFATMPLGATAAFLAPGFGSVTLTDVCLLALCLSMVGRIALGDVLTGILLPAPGFALLVLLSLSTLGAVFLPQIFEMKALVYAVVPSDPYPQIKTVPLAPNGTNLAQLGRLCLSGLSYVAVVAVMSRDGNESLALRAIFAATTMHIAVSLADWLSTPLGAEALLLPLRTVGQAILVDQQFSGLRRLIGGHTEPASFGLYTMGLYGVWLGLWLGRQRLAFAGLMALGLALLALRSTSTATIANLAVFTALALGWQFRFATRNAKSVCLFLGAVAVAPALIGGMYFFHASSGGFADLVDTLFLDKGQSLSGQERMRWNAQALRNLGDSYGLGLGIGSVRASGGAASVLGNLGVLGTLAYLWFLFVLLSSGKNAVNTRALCVAAALRCGCLAVLLQAMLTRPYPDLGIPFFAMAGLSVALSHPKVRSAPSALIPRFRR